MTDTNTDTDTNNDNVYSDGSENCNDTSDNMGTSDNLDVNKIRNEVHSNIKEYITLISNVSCNISC